MTIREQLKQKSGEIMQEKHAICLLEYFGLNPRNYGTEFESRRKIDTICDYIGLE